MASNTAEKGEKNIKLTGVLESFVKSGLQEKFNA